MIAAIFGRFMPYLWAASVLAGALGSVYAYFEGKKAGVQEVQAQENKERNDRIQLRDEVQKAVAEGFKHIEVRNETIIKNFRAIEKRVPVYTSVDCTHPDDVLKLLNDALQRDGVRAKPAVPGSLP